MKGLGEMHRMALAALSVVLPCLFLWIGRESCVSRSVSVAFSVEASEPSLCLLLYTESPDEPYSFEKAEKVAIRPGVTDIDVSLPVKRLERLRMDVRDNPMMARWICRHRLLGVLLFGGSRSRTGSR